MVKAKPALNENEALTLTFIRAAFDAAHKNVTFEKGLCVGRDMEELNAQNAKMGLGQYSVVNGFDAIEAQDAGAKLVYDSLSSKYNMSQADIGAAVEGLLKKKRGRELTMSSVGFTPRNCKL